MRIHLIIRTASIFLLSSAAALYLPAPAHAGGAGSPEGGIATDSSGNVYIADYGDNVVGVVKSGIMSLFAGTGTAGYLPSDDGGYATNAELNGPTGVAVDTAGNVYIADQGNNRIRKVNTSGIISTYVGNGTAGSSGDYGQATAATLNGPDTISVDSSGNLYIADQNNNRIREVNASTHIITTVAGTGSPGYDGEGTATAYEIQEPYGVTVVGR